MTRKGGRLKSRDLAEAVHAKDLVALKEVQRAAHYLGIAVGSLITLSGPEKVIIGGGVAGALGDSYIDLVRGSARAQAITDPEGKIVIDRAALGDDAGMPGCSACSPPRATPVAAGHFAGQWLRRRRHHVPHREQKPPHLPTRGRRVGRLRSRREVTTRAHQPHPRTSHWPESRYRVLVESWVACQKSAPGIRVSAGVYTRRKHRGGSKCHPLARAICLNLIAARHRVA